MSISRTLFYATRETMIPKPEQEKDDAWLSPMPARSARHKRCCRWHAHEAGEPVRLSVDPYDLARHVPRDADERRTVGPARDIHAPYRLPPARLRPRCAPLDPRPGHSLRRAPRAHGAHDRPATRCDGALPEA